MSQKCIDCLYWEGDRKNDRSQGICHFDPPRVIGLINQPNMAGQTVPTPITALPVTNAQSWCGKFEPVSLV